MENSVFHQALSRAMQRRLEAEKYKSAAQTVAEIEESEWCFLLFCGILDFWTKRILEVDDSYLHALFDSYATTAEELGERLLPPNENRDVQIDFAARVWRSLIEEEMHEDLHALFCHSYYQLLTFLKARVDTLVCRPFEIEMLHRLSESVEVRKDKRDKVWEQLEGYVLIPPDEEDGPTLLNKTLTWLFVGMIRLLLTLTIVDFMNVKGNENAEWN